ncbi:hypothetical protein CC2G_005602 [Coprinopsis cinerea AmutBmut pab1-1]|nr:hypothetical protein CC2G_005602 [Coprinopsis cinerea AmutBmut pab1-1]
MVDDNAEEEDEEADRLQQELQEAMDIDAELSELHELEKSAAEAPEISTNDEELALEDDLFGDDQEEPPQLGQARGISPGTSAPPPLDIPLLNAEDDRDASMQPLSSPPQPQSPTSVTMGSPARRRRSPSPETRHRRSLIFAPIGSNLSTSSLALNGTAPPPSDPVNASPRTPRSYAVEAICALPHPVPTNALASSQCMTHFITGSDDGYIRSYDIFAAVNGKTFLTQPQRQHAGVVEGLFKSGQIRCWWENPAIGESQRRLGLLSNLAMPQSGPFISTFGDDSDGLAPVYSLLMHSDGLWALAGSDSGHINLFTVRHEPGRLIHTMDKHRGPVSAMAMDYDEKSFFSAGWDGEALQWDLNTGKNVRNFIAHGAQLAAIAVRPDYSGPYVDPSPPAAVVYRRKDRKKERRDKEDEEFDGDSNPILAAKMEDPITAATHTRGPVDVSMGDATGSMSLLGGSPSKHDSQTPVPQESSSNPTEPDAMDGQGDDADNKSDDSFDPLFDEEGDDGDGEGNPTPPQPAEPSNSPPAQQQLAKGSNPYSNITFTAPLNPATNPPGNVNAAKPVVPGAPQSHFVTFNLGPSAPQGNQQQSGVQSYFHAIPPAAQPAPPPQGGQQFQFQLAKPSGASKAGSVSPSKAQQQQQSQPPPLPPPPPQPQPPRAASVKPSRPATQAPSSSIGGGIAAPKNAPPLLEPAGYQNFSSDLLMTAFVDGQVILWDRRVSSPGRGVGRLWMSEKTPPWCLSACWSWDGGQIYAGRRNGTIDVWDVRLMGRSGPDNIPRLLKTIRNPPSSGVVSCVVPFPDCRHIACASVDNIRLWNVAEAAGEDSSMSRSSRGGVLFKIIPGHHGGYISQMLVDPGARFMITASSNRGWHGDSTRTVFVHDIKQLF